MVLIRDALLVDGTGGQPRRADVLTDGDRIARIGAPGTLTADDVIEASGHALAPGFIDMHAHSDLAVIADRAHLAKISQGVTTEVIGQDGLGYAPTDASTLPAIRTQIAGWNGHDDLAVDWHDMAGYLTRLREGTPANVAVLVPQGNLRMLVVGHRNRPATAAELDAMCELLDAALSQGAVGMSSGLTYTPGMYADEAELTALCRVVAAHGGFWAPHTRSYGAGAMDSFAEAIRIAGAAGCGVNLTHATLNFASNAGRAPEFLAMVDEAIAAGTDVTIDSYPYLPGATTLAALLPSWIAEGGPQALQERLAAGTDRDRLAEAFDVTGCDGFHGEVADWSRIQISGVGDASLEPLVGRTVAEIAGERGEDTTDTVMDLLVADDLATGVLMHIGHEENVQAVMRHPAHCGGSDGILIGSRPHPRAWGTFPRYLARYVREKGVLSLAECVRHLTANPARRLGLDDRGLVREGYAADLVLFDPETVRDTATFEQPRQCAEGIEAVWVNGRLAYRDGQRTDVVAGRVLSAGR